MHAKYEVSTSNGSKVIANLKVDNRQTNRQDKNNMPQIIRSGGIKNKLLLKLTKNDDKIYQKLNISFPHR